MTETTRDRAKAQRYANLLQAASRLFAERGYPSVSLEDLGAAVGFSGPAVYRHVSSKQALLGAVLVQASENLLDRGLTVVEQYPGGLERMRALIQAHVAFALANPDVIRVQDREVPHLSEEDFATVRALQRKYIGLWSETLADLRDESAEARRLRVQAVFGLLNSTPHSTSAAARGQATTARVLATMAEAALLDGAG